MDTHTHLQSSRDDPEEVGHDVRDEQVRVDCVAQAAEVPVRHHQSRIPNNVITAAVKIYVRTVSTALES